MLLHNAFVVFFLHFDYIFLFCCSFTITFIAFYFLPCLFFLFSHTLASLYEKFLCFYHVSSSPYSYYFITCLLLTSNSYFNFATSHFLRFWYTWAWYYHSNKARKLMIAWKIVFHSPFPYGRGVLLCRRERKIIGIFRSSLKCP